MLLSFAQFEREVTGERIRDKIAASKKKGMWMGGSVPLGYRVDKRKLLVVPEDAERVRRLFRRYLELGNVRLLQDEITADNMRSRNGKIISRGNLYNMLSNPIYIGQISHKGVCHPGQHDAIIGLELWEEVQRHLTGNRKGTKGKVAKSERCPLARKLFDASGERLVPVHARKEERRYRYYVLESLVLRPAAESPDGWRLPGAEIENTVAQAAICMLQDQEALTSTLHEHDVEVHGFSAILARAKVFFQRLSSDAERPDALAALIRRVDLKRDGLTVTLLLSALIEQPGAKADIVMVRETAIRMRRRGVETKLT